MADKYPYWQMFKNLERELLALSETIYINEKQLDVYSSRIADLLVRTVVEIEALSKELYIKLGGVISESRRTPFDFECLATLDHKFALFSRVVFISSPYLELPENMTSQKPLENVSQRGSPLWKNAYNAVKHDRAHSFHCGTIRNFINALAALYLLNVYYEAKEIDLKHTPTLNDRSFGSDIFSVKVHAFPGTAMNGQYNIAKDYDECSYLIYTPDETLQKNAHSALLGLDKILNDKSMELAITRFNEDCRKGKIKESEIKGLELGKLFGRYFNQAKSERAVILEKAIKPADLKPFLNLNYKAVINIGQFKQRRPILLDFQN